MKKIIKRRSKNPIKRLNNPLISTKPRSKKDQMEWIYDLAASLSFTIHHDNDGQVVLYTNIFN